MREIGVARWFSNQEVGNASIGGFVKSFRRLTVGFAPSWGVEKSFLFTFDLPPERSAARLRHCRIFPGVNKTSCETLITDVVGGLMCPAVPGMYAFVASLLLCSACYSDEGENGRYGTRVRRHAQGNP